MAQVDSASVSADKHLNQRTGNVSSSGRRKRRMTFTKFLMLLIVVVALAAAAVFGIKYHNAQNRANRLASDPQAAARASVQTIVNDVSKLVQLPSNETPTLATVTDSSKLKSQTFFAKAQNGDKVLIYTQAKQAILYRPSTNKIINIAPLVIGNGNSSNSTSPSNSGQ